jgi:hypothetical protein
MKWRAFGRMPQWVRLSEWLGVAAFAGQVCIDLRKQCLPAFKASCRPNLLAFIVLGEDFCSSRQNDPRLFGLGEDMHFRWHGIRFIECAYPYDLCNWPSASVVTPHRDFAMWAASYLLPSSTFRRCIYDFGLDAKVRYPVRFDHCVYCKSRPCFALTPSAVATVDDQRC